MAAPLPERPAAVLALLPVLVAVSLVVTACGGGGVAEEEEATGEGFTTGGSTTVIAPAPTTDETIAASTSTDSGVFFPEHEDGPIPSSLGSGELMVDHAGCIRVDSGPYDTASTIVWPPEYALGIEDGEALILDGEGRVVARVGDQVTIGGGGMNGLEGVSGVDERTRHELHERCPGPYFYAGEVVNAQQR